MLLDQYAMHIHDAIEKISATQKEKIWKATQFAAKTIENDGLIYVFGCGHSHILSEETFYRAGGLACVAPIFWESLMLHESAWESSRLEKQSGYAQQVADRYSLEPRDLMICISTSDKNAVPVEFAHAVKDLNVPVIGICSSAYFDQPVHNLPEKHLHDVCDLYIDNMAPFGDACLIPKGADVGMMPLSTITGCFIINSILAQAAELALEHGAEVPIYLSGNVPGGTERNQYLVERYKSRIPHL